MSKCMQVLASGVVNHRLAGRSEIYSKVREAAAVDAVDTNVSVLDRPDLLNFEFVPTISVSGEAKLVELQEYTPPEAPPVDFELPELEHIAYSALREIIEYEFYSDPFEDLEYPEHYPPQDDFLELELEPPNLEYPIVDDLLPEPKIPEFENEPITPVGLESIPAVLDHAQHDLTWSLLDKMIFDFAGLGLVPVFGAPFLRGNAVDREGVLISPLPELDDYSGEWVSQLHTQKHVNRLDFAELGFVPNDAPPDARFLIKLKETMRGFDEIVHWVESTTQSKLYDSDIRKLKYNTKQQAGKVLYDTAGKNFSLPHGPAEELLLTVYRDELENSYEIAQRIRDEVYEAAMTTLLDAVTQSVASEQRFFSDYITYVRQNVRVYEMNLALAKAGYDAANQIYSRYSSALDAQRSMYEGYLQIIREDNKSAVSFLTFEDSFVRRHMMRSRLARSKIELEHINDPLELLKVRRKIPAIQARIDELRAKSANLQLIKMMLDGYKQAIEAHSRYVLFFDNMLKAYQSSVDVGKGIVSLAKDKIAAYKRLWSVEERRLGHYTDYLRTTLKSFDIAVEDYRDAVSAQRKSLAKTLSMAREIGKAKSAQDSAQRSVIGLADAYNSTQISYKSALNSVGLADADATLAQDIVEAEAAAIYSRLDAAQQAATVTAAGALAQAASTIFQVGLSATGSANHRVSGRDTGRMQASVTDRKNFSKVCTYVERPMTL